MAPASSAAASRSSAATVSVASAVRQRASTGSIAWWSSARSERSTAEPADAATTGHSSPLSASFRLPISAQSRSAYRRSAVAAVAAQGRGAAGHPVGQVGQRPDVGEHRAVHQPDRGQVHLGLAVAARRDRGGGARHAWSSRGPAMTDLAAVLSAGTACG